MLSRLLSALPPEVGADNSAMKLSAMLYLYDSEPGILQLSLPDSLLHLGMVLWELLFLWLLLLVALICVAPNLPSSPQICRLLFPLELEAVQLHVYEGQFHCV